MLSIDEFDYELPPTAIAQTPVEPRDSARLLDALGPSFRHRRVRDFAQLVGPGDVIVVNDTRVLPARLKLSKTTGGAAEVMLLDPLETTIGDPARPGTDRQAERPNDAWRALVRPSRRIPPGTVLLDAGGVPAVRVDDDLGDGVRVVRSQAEPSMLDVAHRLGQVPLPPYITSTDTEPDRYQTVYARNENSVAAPTAGLHFTPDLLDACRAAGAEIHRVELAVGLGTFRPILVDDVNDHDMHAERYRVEPQVLEACRAAERTIAIGTTSVRALESAATYGRSHGETELFISPGYEFKLVDTLWTNFHQPRSSLLVMLAAFAGPRWHDVYAAALAHDYRFLSFGDAMIIDRADRHQRLELHDGSENV